MMSNTGACAVADEIEEVTEELGQTSVEDTLESKDSAPSEDDKSQEADGITEYGAETSDESEKDDAAGFVECLECDLDGDVEDDDPEVPIPFGLGDAASAKSGVMEITPEQLGKFEDDECPEMPDVENEGMGKEPHHSWDLSTKEIGKEGEKLAAAYLSQQGYEVVKTNEWFANNEVDIIAFDPSENEYVLVEVKTRTDFGNKEVIPEIAVTRQKQRRYRNAALLYLATRDLSHVRFDVIAINIVAERHARLRHLVGAYTFDY